MEKYKRQKKVVYLPELISALLVLLFRFINYKNLEFAGIKSDSRSYITGWGGFREGNRMPLYPAIANLNKLLFNDAYLTGMVWCQIMVSLIAVVFFYKAVKIATRNRLIACIAAVFYGCYPGVMGFDTFILSESFALSLSVFLLYFTVRYIQNSTWKNGKWMFLLVFLALCVKSALFIYVPAVFVLLVLQFFLQKEKRGTIYRLMGINLLITMFLLVHAGQVYVYSGTFSIDHRGPRHTLAACLQSGVYKNYPNHELVREIEKIYMESDQKVGGKVLNAITGMFGNNMKEYNSRLTEFNSYCIRSDPGHFVSYLFSRFTDNTNIMFMMDKADLATADENMVDQFVFGIQNLAIPVLCIGHIYLIDLMALVLLIRKWMKNGECPWYYLGTVGILSAIVISVFLGTYCDYNRCMVYVLPFAFFGVALFLNDLTCAIQRYKMEPI